MKLKGGGEGYWSRDVLVGRGFADYSRKLGAFGACECARCDKKVGLDVASLIAEGGLGIRCIDCLHVFCLPCGLIHFGKTRKPPKWWNKWKRKWPFKRKMRKF